MVRRSYIGLDVKQKYAFKCPPTCTKYPSAKNIPCLRLQFKNLCYFCLTINFFTSGRPSNPLPAPPNASLLSITYLHHTLGAISPMTVFPLLTFALVGTGNALPSNASIARLAKPTAFLALDGTLVFSKDPIRKLGNSLHKSVMS